MKALFSWMIICVFIAGCGKSNSNLNLEKLEDLPFRIVTLNTGTKIKILSFSGGPVCTPDETYYYQYIGIIQGTSDTIRVLSPCQTIPDGDQPEEGSFSPWDSTSKIIKDVMKEYGEKNIETENKIVVFNKNNSQLERREFKTAIGSLSF
jgi:hypothetical protein